MPPLLPLQLPRQRGIRGTPPVTKNPGVRWADNLRRLVSEDGENRTVNLRYLAAESARMAGGLGYVMGKMDADTPQEQHLIDLVDETAHALSATEQTAREAAREEMRKAREHHRG